MRESLLAEASRGAGKQGLHLVLIVAMGLFLLSGISNDCEVFGAVVLHNDAESTQGAPINLNKTQVQQLYNLLGGNSTLPGTNLDYQLSIVHGVKSGRKGRNMGSCANDIHYHFYATQNAGGGNSGEGGGSSNYPEEGGGGDDHGGWGNHPNGGGWGNYPNGGGWGNHANGGGWNWGGGYPEEERAKNCASHESEGDNHHPALTCAWTPCRAAVGSFPGETACHGFNRIYPGRCWSFWIAGNGCKGADRRYDCCGPKPGKKCYFTGCGSSDIKSKDRCKSGYKDVQSYTELCNRGYSNVYCCTYPWRP